MGLAYENPDKNDKLYVWIWAGNLPFVPPDPPLSLLNLLSDQGGWPVWAAIMGSIVLWILVNLAIRRHQQEVRKRVKSKGRAFTP